MDRLKQYWNENVLLLQTSFDRFNDVAYVTIKDKNTGKKELIKLESPRVPVYFANKELNIISSFKENKAKAEEDLIELFEKKNELNNWLLEQGHTKYFSGMLDMFTGQQDC